MNLHIQYMKRCLELANNGKGNTSPNPMVGSVIVYKNRIIGEGYHIQHGGPHAEVNAINSVTDKSLLKKSCLYVSLEPCSHFGKTPPCSQLIIKYKIPEVIIGCTDPNPKVSGRGIQQLKDAGIIVQTDILEKECLELNKRFFTFHIKKRPYIIFKWAQTLDGYMDIDRKGNEQTKEKYWITNKELKILVHKWRSEEDAIMAGTNTITNDNPQLNVREWHGKNPTRIIIDRHNRLPTSSAIFDQSQPTIIYTLEKKDCITNLEYIVLSPEKDTIEQIIDSLYHKNLQSIIIEGGKKLLESFIEKGLWDEARILIGNKGFGSGLKAPELNSTPQKITSISDDKLLIYINKE